MWAPPSQPQLLLVVVAPAEAPIWSASDTTKPISRGRSGQYGNMYCKLSSACGSTVGGPSGVCKDQCNGQ